MRSRSLSKHDTLHVLFFVASVSVSWSCAKTRLLLLFLAEVVALAEDVCAGRPQCRMFCENGFVKDDIGCDVCECLEGSSSHYFALRVICLKIKSFAFMFSSGRVGRRSVPPQATVQDVLRARLREGRRWLRQV